MRSSGTLGGRCLEQPPVPLSPPLLPTQSNSTNIVRNNSIVSFLVVDGNILPRQGAVLLHVCLCVCVVLHVRLFHLRVGALLAWDIVLYYHTHAHARARAHTHTHTQHLLSAAVCVRL